MSEQEKHDEHSSFIKTPKQLLAVVILAFVVPIFIISLLASIASRSVEPSATAFSEEAIAKRLKPVGEVVVVAAPAEPAAAAATAVTVAAGPAVATGATTTAPAGGAAGDASKGKSVYDASCAACHTAGVAGAPKFADKAAWAPRLKQGVPALYEAAIKGKGAMPPKGGNVALADGDVKAAVDFMVGQAK